MSLSTAVQPAQSSQADAHAEPSCVVETLDADGRSANPQAWRRLFEQADHSRVHHHTDYVASALPNLGTPAWSIAVGNVDAYDSLGIFIPKRLKFGRQLLPGAKSTLVGVRLAGFGLLGNNDPKNVSEVVNTLADEVQQRSIPVVEFEEIEEDSALWSELQKLQSRGFRFVPSSDFDAHRRVRLPETIDEYWGGFKSKSRYTLRKKRKKLGDYRVRRYTQTHEIEEFLAAAHEISLNTWQTHQLGLRVRADESERRYLEFLADRGAWRSYVLSLDEKPVAFVLSHQWAGVYHYDELGFDRNLVHLSPGNVLLQEIIDDLILENRPEVLDFGLGDADYKQFFGNEETRSATIRMFSPGFGGWWQTTSMSLRSQAVNVARTIAEKSGLAARLRQKLRDRAASS